jgi:hypothetical protein
MLKKVVAKPQRGARIGNLYAGWFLRGRPRIFQRGARIGNLYAGLFHVWQSHVTWQGGRVAMDPEEFAEELRRQFETQNLPVVGDPRALFEDPTEWKAEYLIGALIGDIKLDL